MLTHWPVPGPRDAEAEATMGLIIQIVRGIRDAEAEMKTPPSHRVPAIISAGANVAELKQYAAIVEELARTRLHMGPPPVDRVVVLVGCAVRPSVLTASR